MKLVTRIKLHTSPDHHQALLLTMRQFSAACNLVSQYAFERRQLNKYDLQDALYGELRSRFKLSSQMAIRAIDKVADTYKIELANAMRQGRDLALCRFRDDSAVVYDSRLLTYSRHSVSIKTVCGRETIPASYHDAEQLPRFHGEADLVLDGNVFYLMQTIVVPEAEPVAVSDYIGVDMGIRNLAYDSDGIPYSNPGLEERRRKIERHQTALKQRKTKNARRRLKRIGKREARYRRDVNHQLSKRIVASALCTSRGIALEELCDFFDRTRVRREQRQERRTWAFRQLRDFLTYKSVLAGIPIVLVPAAYTSQTCSACGHCEDANRRSQSDFVCCSCGFACHADYNAARNIRLRAVVNQRIAATARRSAASRSTIGTVVDQITITGQLFPKQFTKKKGVGE